MAVSGIQAAKPQGGGREWWPVAVVVVAVVLGVVVAVVLVGQQGPRTFRVKRVVSPSGGSSSGGGSRHVPPAGHNATTASGRTSRTKSSASSPRPFKPHRDPAIAAVLAETKRDYMRHTLRFLAKEPHLSGTDRSEKQVVDFIASEFKKHGLDMVEKVPYRILHQYPDKDNPNKVQLVDARGKVVDEAKLMEDPVAGDNADSMVPGYLSFALPGTVEADVVHVGAGTYDDVDELEARNVSLKGRICLARYSGGHRGGKVTVCQERGGVGAVLYLDLPKKPDKGYYPNSDIVDGSALQRGSLFIPADPETPGYPSVDGVFRLTNSSALPKIPALTVTNNFAMRLLSQIEGPEVAISERPVKLGSFKDGKKLRLVVRSKWARPIVYNVIGTIRGRLEPDRYSITGAHHDAWGFGAVDPSSATTSLIELSRRLGAQLKGGWRPRRSIVLAAWAAEESSIGGSSEWVEDKLLLLDRGGVGYVNVDNCVSGIMFFAYASPVLNWFLGNATKLVPFNRTQTLYDYWLGYEKVVQNLTVYLTHGGMDNTAFNFLAGVPSAIFTFRPDKRKYSLGSYPSYHTAFETLRLYEQFLDPAYHYMDVCTRFTGLLTMLLAEAPLLPYDFRKVAAEMQRSVDNLHTHKELLADHGVPLDWLKREVSLYAKAADGWHKWLATAKLSEAEQRQVNDRALLVERALLQQGSLSGRPTFRHLVFSPQVSNAYAGKGFPVVHDLVYRIGRLKPGPERERLWRQVRAFVNQACIAIRAAHTLLSPDLALPLAA